VREYENIVIGSSLTALLYAFNNNYPVFFAQERRPFRFDYFDPDVDLSALKIPTCNKSLTTFDGVKLIGQAKELLWERLLFLLSLDGKAPLSNLCRNIRYDGEHVACSNEYSKIAEFSFKECFYFGDDQTTGFTVQKTLDEDIYICYDYIAFNRGGKHEIDYIETADNFVREIWFYPSDRIDGNSPVKDACIVSTLTEGELDNFDHSETMARFKMISEMESRGMKGKFNGYGPNGRPKHYKFRTTHVNRTKNKSPQEKIRVGDGAITAPALVEADLVVSLEEAAVMYNQFLR
jgi:hypothetical protein